MSTAVLPAPAAAVTAQRWPWLVAALLLGALALRLLVFTGTGGTDDVAYTLRGLEIGQNIWRPGNVTDLRFGMAIPIALSAWWFGHGEVALTAWPLFCSLLDIAVAVWVGHAYFGRRVAIVAGVLMAVMPLHLAMGGRNLADASFGAFTTLAFASFLASVHRPSALFPIVTGLAAGVLWWTKPNATVPLLLALMIGPLVLRRWERRWLWAAVAFVGCVAIEWLLLWSRFGDPLFTLRQLLGLLGGAESRPGDAGWGDHSPWFWFHRLLLDGRELWLLPHLAIAGALVAGFFAQRSTGPQEAFARRFVLYWLLALLLVFSFFVASLSPFKLIPKQENYATIFVAPLALVAAWGLARLRWHWLLPVLVAVAVPGLLLAGLQQQEHRGKVSRLAQAVGLAEREPGALVLVSAQTMALSGLLARRDGTLPPPNLRPWVTLDPRAVPAGASRQQPLAAAQGSDSAKLFVAEAASSELSTVGGRALLTAVRGCGLADGSIATQAAGAGRLAVAATGALRAVLPAAVDRQLRFTDSVLQPPTTPVYRLGAGCPPP